MKGVCMSNKERQRRFREKRDSDPGKRAEYLAKRRKKNISDLKDGKRKNDQLTEREKREVQGVNGKQQRLQEKKEIAKQSPKLKADMDS